MPNDAVLKAKHPRWIYNLRAAGDLLKLCFHRFVLRQRVGIREGTPEEAERNIRKVYERYGVAVPEPIEKMLKNDIAQWRTRIADNSGK